MAVAVSTGEWVLYEGGFGLADAASGRRVTADSNFSIASSTKALTATAVVLMAGRGEIDQRRRRCLGVGARAGPSPDPAICPVRVAGNTWGLERNPTFGSHPRRAMD